MKKKSAIFLLSACLALFWGSAHAQVSFSIKIIPKEPYAERSQQPTANHVWVESEWVWQNNNYVLQPAHWAVPEKDKIWVKGEWVSQPDGSAYWRPGYWKPIPHIGISYWLPEPEYLRPPRPSQRHVWVEGEWIWINNRYMYQTGYWAVPEPDRIFVKGHWAQWPNNEWYWVNGYWRTIPENVYAATVPEEPVYSRPPQPSPQHVWIEGEWQWRGNGFTFQTGYWSAPNPHKRWVRGYWHQRQNGGWYWVGGHWDLV